MDIDHQLRVAIRSESNLRLIKRLVQAGAKFDGNWEGNVEYFKYFHSIGMIDIKNKLSDFIRTSSDLKLIKFLVQNGEDVYEKDKLGNTILHLAMYTKNNTYILKYLVEECGLNPNDVNLFDQTPLDIAKKLGGRSSTVIFLQPLTTIEKMYLTIDNIKDWCEEHGYVISEKI